MNFKWAATLVIVVGALAAWRTFSPTPDRGGATPLDVVAQAPIDARAVALAKEVARLRDRLEPGVSLPHHGRDLFRFATAAPHAAPLALVTNPAPSDVAIPSQPLLKLIGVAEDTTTDGLVRTAIISGPGQLYVVKEGDRVTSRYRVARISPDVVELDDLARTGDASVLRLALK